MNKICTSIEQSKKLIELGIDTSSADMCYDLGGGEEKAHLECDNFITYFTNDEYPESADRYIPAWSLSALLDVIKPINENTYTIRGTLDGGATISFDEITNVMFQEEEIIDAAFKMICWLKENGKI